MGFLRRILLALLFALLFGFAIGTLIRLRLERPLVYLGSAVAPAPLDIGNSGAVVLGARHHEEQIG